MFIILTTIVIQVRQFNNQKEFNNNEYINIYSCTMFVN